MTESMVSVIKYARYFGENVLLILSISGTPHRRWINHMQIFNRYIPKCKWRKDLASSNNCLSLFTTEIISILIMPI